MMRIKNGDRLRHPEAARFLSDQFCHSKQIRCPFGFIDTLNRTAA